MSTSHQSTDRLSFHKKCYPGNPVALNVCAESRAVALKRYHIVFGTTNVYADLSCDILYFGSHWNDPFRGNELLSAKYGSLFTYKGKNRSDIVRSDLKAVKMLALRRSCWRVIPLRHNGLLLSEVNKSFPNLQKLLLVQGSEHRVASDFSAFPSRVEISMRPQALDPLFSTIASFFKSKPDLVYPIDVGPAMERPDESWDYYFGEPYVISSCISRCSPLMNCSTRS